MRITAFNPFVITPRAEEVATLFEELGFERAHTKEGINGRVTSYGLKYGEDFRVNVAQSESVLSSADLFETAADSEVQGDAWR